MSSLTFIVPGDPTAWERTGVVRNKSGELVHYTKKGTRTRERRVSTIAWVAMLEAKLEHLEHAARLDVFAIFDPSVPPQRRGDWDNIGKAVSDALNKTVWIDDRQVSIGHVEKRDAKPGEEPHTVVTVTSLEGEWPA